MDQLEQLKTAINLADLIESQHSLTGRGRYRYGVQHDSLVVDTATQHWWWWSRTQHGDAIDWVGRYVLGYDGTWNPRDRDMFGSALTELADLAGIPAPTLKREDEETRLRRLKRVDLLAQSHQHYRHAFESANAAKIYAQQRGWSEVTLNNAQLGYSTGQLHTIIAPPDRPLAVEIGLLMERDGRIFDAIPAGMLVYPHFVAGKIGYFSGRSIKAKKHANIAGKKEIFWALPQGYGGDLVVVEGQADAITVGHEWGISCLALCGVNLAALDIDLLKLFDRIYIATDTDKAGKNSLNTLADAVSPLIRRVQFPEIYLRAKQTAAKDPNDLLQAGARRDDMRRWMDEAPVYLDILITQVKNMKDADRDQGMQRLFQFVARLDGFPLTRYRNKIVKSLDINRFDFNRFLSIAKNSTADEEERFFKGEQYQVRDGWTVAKRINANGTPQLMPLANAQFKIAELVTHDNGSGDVFQEYTVSGELATGRKLPAYQIPTSEFEQMKWIAEKYPYVVVEAGRATRDTLRAAIQHLSGEFPRRKVIEHTGWRTIAGKHVYLTPGGAVGLPSEHPEKIEVDLRAGRPHTNLQRYALPANTINKEDLKLAVRASLDYWDIMGHTATIPQWAATYLAPLGAFLPADFGLWVHGKSGSFKSVVAMLALAHFGDWTGRYAKDHAPGNFISTVNEIMMNAFLTKDILFVIDDFAPGNTPREMRERDEVASRLLRSLGNKAARGRMQDGRRFQASYPPRCLALITAEDIPPGQSILARGIGVRVITPPPGSPDRAGIIERITKAQDADSTLYPLAMSGYIQWIIANWDNLSEQLPKLAAQNSRRIKAVGHARLADAFAKLLAAVETALLYFVEIGAIDKAEAKERRSLAFDALQTIMAEHAGQIESLDPSEIFAETLRENLDSLDWFLEPANLDETSLVTFMPAEAGLQADGSFVQLLPKNAQRVGWYDDIYIYLLPKAVKMAMESYGRTAGTPFPVGRNSLYLRLEEKGWLLTGKKASMTHFIPARGTSPRVLKILKSAVFQENEN